MTASAAKSMWVKLNAWAVFMKLVSLPNNHQRFHMADCINFAVMNVSRVQPAAQLTEHVRKKKAFDGNPDNMYMTFIHYTLAGKYKVTFNLKAQHI